MKLFYKLILSIVSGVLLIILLQYLEVNILGVAIENSVVKNLLVDPFKQFINIVFQGIGSPFNMVKNFFEVQMPPALEEYAGVVAFLFFLAIAIAISYIAYRIVT